MGGRTRSGRSTGPGLTWALSDRRPGATETVAAGRRGPTVSRAGGRGLRRESNRCSIGRSANTVSRLRGGATATCSLASIRMKAGTGALRGRSAISQAPLTVRVAAARTRARVRVRRRRPSASRWRRSVSSRSAS